MRLEGCICPAVPCGMHRSTCTSINDLVKFLNMPTTGSMNAITMKRERTKSWDLPCHEVEAICPEACNRRVSAQAQDSLCRAVAARETANDCLPCPASANVVTIRWLLHLCREIGSSKAEIMMRNITTCMV